MYALGVLQPPRRLSPSQEFQWLSHASLDPSAYRRLLGPTKAMHSSNFEGPWLKQISNAFYKLNEAEGEWDWIFSYTPKPRGRRTVEAMFATETGAFDFLLTFMQHRVPKALRGGLIEDLEMVGQEAVVIARNMLGEYQPGWPVLSQSTLEQNVADTPLYRTGELRESIHYDIDESTLTVSIGSNDPYAALHELGSSTEPPRPFLIPAISEAMKGLPAALVNTIDVAFRPASGEMLNPWPEHHKIGVMKSIASGQTPETFRKFTRTFGRGGLPPVAAPGTPRGYTRSVWTTADVVGLGKSLRGE